MMESMLQAWGGILIAIDETEAPDDLVGDMTDTLTRFCTPLRHEPRRQGGLGGGLWLNRRAENASSQPSARDWLP